jgi:hypothetical protein
MKSIVDPSFHYVPSADTDIRKTFERIRLEMQQKSQVSGNALATRSRSAPPPVSAPRASSR